MEQSRKFFSASERPPEAGTPQLTVRFEIFGESDRRGGCAANFGAPEGSELVAKYGGKARALAACRDLLVRTLDDLIEQFHDEE